MARTQKHRGGLSAYLAKRDFTATSEPPPRVSQSSEGNGFVVQKHRAKRAGLHWDFRLEHGGVLWSWAVPKGPSLDPADRRMAIHVEDHPVDYADFQGEIAQGYGAGHVETWDRGTWEPLEDPEAGLRDGHLRFLLNGSRLQGRFTLARLKSRDPRRPEAWFLIKGHDDFAREGSDAAAIESSAADRVPPSPAATPHSAVAAPGAVRGPFPAEQKPQLCQLSDEPPDGTEWATEIKFDGYRLLVAIQNGTIRLITRNGLDWAERLPAVVQAVTKLHVHTAMLDGELVSLNEHGVSSFPALQTQLKAGKNARLVFYAFDLLYKDGWDLRACTLLDRKKILAELMADGKGVLRYSEHLLGDTHAMRRNACRLHAEGIVCKRANAPYRAGRGSDWLKLKCSGREEFIVVGWTPPAGSRIGIGSLHVGYYDPEGGLQYAGGVGSGFDEAELRDFRARLKDLAAPGPGGLVYAGEPIDSQVNWVRPELVIEVEFTAWSGAGRLRHGVYLGVREDKPAQDVVRGLADPAASRVPIASSRGARRYVVSVPPARKPVPSPQALTTSPPKRAAPQRAAAAKIVVTPAPKRAGVKIAGVTLSHADRPLWPADGGPPVTKQQLAEYWQAVADVALPGIAQRPLSILRCPDGIHGKEQFFQKNGHGMMPEIIREGAALRQPFIAIDGLEGLVGLAQFAAIEIHTWGATESDPEHPDRLVFDLDPGEGVAFAEVIRAALDVRERLKQLGLVSFCRSTGGKGLHVVTPLRHRDDGAADWNQAKLFCRALAETMAREEPERFVSHVKIADRHGKILVDWLRNGPGATAVASFSPRARPGATVATPLAWDELTPTLQPASYTVFSVPKRIAALGFDPWEGFAAARQGLPALPAAKRVAQKPAGKARIVVASKPKPSSRR